ncbi:MULTISPECIES: protein translocase subunit SecF [unclassified Lysobacter]|uniref:protein translocase subunit SecF n=1 Tax=unclassified Lysobacter TaxID=2635362 RepID=UPI001C2133C5|nr:protein translocase subunit SecF [Lysobacter sp. MMG2]MBU8976357.1 protein translocase subunit SecF [Lysobacter sp. MMG2]
MKPFNIFPYDSNINFIRLRWISLSIAMLMLVVAIGAMVFKGFNFALDFTGGTVAELRFEKPVDVDDVRQRLEQAGYDNAQVQTFGSGNDLLIRLQPKENAAPAGEGAEAGAAINQVASDIQSALAFPDNPGRVLRNEFVGPQVGKDLATNGIWALIFVIVGFLIYISFRFERKFAIAAVLATLHDVLVVAGWFALTGHEFDLIVLAGVLSVMGYSINDTIVVFDRVRENFRSMRGTPEEILNKSVNQTLSRTVITSFVAFLTVLALYLYGGGSLQGMAESQMIGIVIGTLSSIFIACPLLTIGFLKVTKQDLMPKAKDEAALARRP